MVVTCLYWIVLFLLNIACRKTVKPISVLIFLVNNSISLIRCVIMLCFSFDIDNGPKAAEYIQVCFYLFPLLCFKMHYHYRVLNRSGNLNIDLYNQALL